jgi:hypothetical protein
MTDTKQLQDRFAALELAISDEIRQRADAVMKAETATRPEWRNWTGQAIAEAKQKLVAYEVQVSKNGEARIRGMVSKFLEELRQEKRDRMFPLRASGTMEGRRSSEFYDAKAREVLKMVSGDVGAFEAEVKNSPEPEYLSWLFHYAGLVGEFKSSLDHIERYQRLKADWLTSLDLVPLEDLISKVEAYAEKLRGHFYFLGLKPPANFREWEERLEGFAAGQVKADGGGDGLIPNLK